MLKKHLDLNFLLDNLLFWASGQYPDLLFTYYPLKLQYFPICINLQLRPTFSRFLLEKLGSFQMFRASVTALHILSTLICPHHLPPAKRILINISSFYSNKLCAQIWTRRAHDETDLQLPITYWSFALEMCRVGSPIIRCCRLHVAQITAPFTLLKTHKSCQYYPYIKQKLKQELLPIRITEASLFLQELP